VGNCIAGQYGINGNISLDPLFCDAANGDFTLQGISPCRPFSMPNSECGQIGAHPVGCGPEAPDYADHNVGNCVLTVTDQGILGFMDAQQTEGSGFIYPADDSNRLHVGSLWIGESSTYVANRDYDEDPAQEWIVSTNPDGHCWMGEDDDSDQDIHVCYTDSAAAEPHGLFVHQESWASAAPDPADDFVILHYAIGNRGDDPLTDLYAGVFLDVDINDGDANTGSTENTCNLVYMADSTGVHVGLSLLQDEALQEPSRSNLTLIPNEMLNGNTYIPDEHKYGLLSASAPEYVVPEATVPGNYRILAAAGPFDLTQGEETLVAFAIIGGSSLEEVLEHARAARTVYWGGYTDVPVPPDGEEFVTRLLPAAPNPFSRTTLIHFELARPSQVHLGVYDVGGRLVRTLAQGRYTEPLHTLTWDSRDESGREVASGVYFVRMAVGGKQETWPLVRIR
jgi:hypothetical protein